MSLYVKIRQWIQPYWRPIEKKKKENVKDKVKSKRIVKNKSKKIDDIINVEIIDLNVSVDRVLKSKHRPKIDEIWYHHSKDSHQVIGHFAPKSGFRFMVRDDKARKAFKPLIYPIGGKKAFDRTHLIPFGYHGLEGHNALVIGWDASQNRNQLAEFEKKAKSLNQPIYWVTDVRMTSTGMTWHYKILAIDNTPIIDLKLKFDCERVAWK